MNDFNALLAQVIPVLLLAAAFESRWLQRKPSRYAPGLAPEADAADGSERRVHWDTNPFQPVVLFLMLLFLAVGEGFALWAVFRGSSQPWMNAWVLLAGLVSLLLVIGPLMLLHLRDFRETFRRGTDVTVNVLHLIMISTIVYVAYLGVTSLAPFQAGGR
jgi:hypothetical protein